MKQLLNRHELAEYLSDRLVKFDLTQMQGAKQIGIAPRIVQQILHPDREKRGISLRTYSRLMNWKPKRGK